MLLSTGLFEEIIDVIANVGFPIGCVVYFAFYTKELNESHKEEARLLSEKLSEMSLKLQELIDKL